MTKAGEIETPLTVMPEKLRLGQSASFTMGYAIHVRDHEKFDLAGRRSVMGFPLPPWQRPFVWTETQCVKFIESAWLGLNLGTYSFNQPDSLNKKLDGLLIDGQQRMRAIERYLDDEFPVFGYRWSEVTEVDRRRFDMSVAFHAYITSSEDEDWLRSYYDLMNFGGTPHTEGQRARADTEEAGR